MCRGDRKSSLKRLTYGLDITIKACCLFWRNPPAVPTSSSWLNLVERWVAELTSKRIRGGTFFTVQGLEKAIDEFLSAWSKNPKPFNWTATVDAIQEKLSRCRQTLEQIPPGFTSPRKKKQKELSG